MHQGVLAHASDDLADRRCRRCDRRLAAGDQAANRRPGHPNGCQLGPNDADRHDHPGADENLRVRGAREVVIANDRRYY